MQCTNTLNERFRMKGKKIVNQTLTHCKKHDIIGRFIISVRWINENPLYLFSLILPKVTIDYATFMYVNDILLCMLCMLKNIRLYSPFFFFKYMYIRATDIQIAVHATIAGI